MKSILFRTLEPMMFRRASEFSPSSRGPQTGAWSNPLPQPSTIAGALATLTLQHTNQHPPKGDPQLWYEEIIEILGGKNSIRLRGTYLMNGQGDIYVQYYDDLLQLDRVLKSLNKGNLFEATKNLTKQTVESKVVRINFVGIKLSDKRKAIGMDETGLLYNAVMVDYGMIGTQKNINCSILVEVPKISDLLKRALEIPRVMRLGGEGRLVQVTSGELQTVNEHVNAEKNISRKLRLYVATPMLFEASPDILTKKFVPESGALTSDLTDRVKTCLNQIGIKVTTCRVIGNLGISGGFSAAKPIRKPIYTSLQPGSVIEVSRDNPFTQLDFSKIYYEGLGPFSDLGYGTVIPIPTAE